MPPRHIAIIGGGLTGLSSAFHLSRRFPASRITVIEKQARLGGWVRSERVDLPDVNVSVVLEGGPRTLRPNAKSVLEMIHLLGLEKSIITVPKTAAAAKARYIYIPENCAANPSIVGLQRIPSTIFSLLSSSLLPILVPPVLLEPFKRANRPSEAKDESLDACMTRRFGEPFARTFGSALVHGVYASDSRKLSVRSAFPTLWEAEERGKGSIVRGFFRGKDKSTVVRLLDYELGGMLKAMKDVSVYSFRDGMETLPQAIVEHISSQSNVRILRETSVSRLWMKKDKSFGMKVSTGQTLDPTHVVSALPLSALHSIIHSSEQDPDTSTSTIEPALQLPNNPTSTVHVVNFVFPAPPVEIHPAGFGYLIPRPTAGYPSSASPSSPGILGTVFDSCSLHEQDTPSTFDNYYHGKVTKLTMMTGGPHPLLPLPPHLSSVESDGTIPESIRVLLDQLALQLGRKLPDPVYWRVWRNEECIPTLLPGHLERVAEMRQELMASDSCRGWDGHFEVVGAGIGGVSVGDCVEAGKRVGEEWS